MSKLFFKGRIDARKSYQSFGYNTNRKVKLGSAGSPLTLLVNSETRKGEIEAILQEHSFYADIEINENEQENILELSTILDKPKAQTKVSIQSRNSVCTCGSGKKFKKCCAV